jgi:hypothetical protein
VKTNDKALRFTGQNPPIELWRQYPNWRNAYEEESEDGQDESTLMPHEVQTHIGEFTSFSSGIACFNDGREFPVFLAIGMRGIDGCEVYEKNIPWRIYYSPPNKKWLSFEAEWLPENERPPFVSFADDTIFPLEIRMTVPWQKSGKLVAYRIGKDGQMREIEH